MPMILKTVLPRRNTCKKVAFVALVVAALLFCAGPISVRAQGAEEDTFSAAELIASGHRLFGSVSRGLALSVQEAVKRWGEPNGYVLGEEASGALIGGLRYGEGVLHTRNAGQRRVYWQGPSLGFDVGGDGRAP